MGQLQADLKIQGMPDESDLMWFELTRHTGRPAAPGDTDGGTYFGKASATKGGVAHRKAGEETYSKVLNEAVANEDFGRIERWNEQLVEVLDSSEHRYAGQASLLIMGMMQSSLPLWAGASTLCSTCSFMTRGTRVGVSQMGRCSTRASTRP